MKQLWLLFLLIGYSSFSKNIDSGTVIILHPEVGKVIDNFEKREYNFFSEYRDDTFNNASIIKYNDSTFGLVINSNTNRSIERSIQKSELDQMYYQVMKNLKNKINFYKNETAIIFNIFDYWLFFFFPKY